MPSDFSFQNSKPADFCPDVCPCADLKLHGPLTMSYLDPTTWVKAEMPPPRYKITCSHEDVCSMWNREKQLLNAADAKLKKNLDLTDANLKRVLNEIDMVNKQCTPASKEEK